MDNSASLRGQVIIWHRFLTGRQNEVDGLFSDEISEELCLRFGSLPIIQLQTRVPKDVWGAPRRKGEESVESERLML